MKKSFTRSTSAVLSVTLAASLVGTTAAANQTQTTEAPELAQIFGDFNFTSTSTTSVIVELDEPSIAEAEQTGEKQTNANLKKERNKVKDELLSEVEDADINREYQEVFSGFSVELSENDIPSLLAIEGVKAVYPNVTYKTMEVGESVPLSEDSFSPDMLDSAPYIGADVAWDAGVTGEGITVAVIDTGVDYTHPDLAHAFGSYKGYDFVDNDNDPQETPKGDPRGAETTHGTHVAGTVAANGLIKGVAPDATLLGYRVLGPGGSGSTEDVVAGIERAVVDGADVMNLSLGNSLNNPDWATSIALDWAMSKGVVAVTSNGNSGPNNWTVGSPGTSREAISVGATALPYNLYSGTLETAGASFTSAKVMGYPSEDALLELNGKELEFVDAGLGQVADFSGKDLNGKVALISRGNIPFVEKAINAKNAGAVAVIIYNNVAGEQPDVAGLELPTFKTSLEDGQKLKAELAAGNNTVTIGAKFDKEIGETVADFSSRGPVVGTWMIKPDVSAPGVAIVSTVPTHDPANPHGYSSKQGTSMASPHVAGAAALLLDKHPTWGVDDVKAALMNTAENLVDPKTGKQYPHNTQGAGSIRVVDALESKSLVMTGSHSFGVFDKKKGKQTEKKQFEVKNLTNKKQSYSITADFGKHGKNIKINYNGNLNNVQPGKTKKVNVSVQVDASKLEPGYYEGTVTVKNGKNVTEVPTILFVQEPDYARVSSVSVLQNGSSFDLSAYFPGGAEEASSFIYYSDANGTPLGLVGDIADYSNLPSGFNNFTWDGKVNGVKLPPGYYNMYFIASKAGKQDLSGVNFEIK